MIFLRDIRRHIQALQVLGILAASSLACFGQAGKSELFGTVQDPSSLAIKEAKISADELATGAKFQTASDERGVYHLLGLPAGEYSLSVEQPGFRSYKQTGLVLRLADQIQLNIQLQIGQPTQTVEVHAEVPLLQTANGSVAFNVSGEKIWRRCPWMDAISSRSSRSLRVSLSLAADRFCLASTVAAHAQTNTCMTTVFAVLQPEPGQVAFYPIIDAMEEIKLNINAYSPEYGRSNGGTVMVIGKSGSNDLHGTLFEFLRNEDLNALKLTLHSPVPNPSSGAINMG